MNTGSLTLSSITVGSKLWGTDCSLSDTETLIITAPCEDELFLGKPFRSEQIEDNLGTTTIWSTGKFLDLLLRGSPDAYAYLPSLREPLLNDNFNVLCSPMKEDWILFCHKAYLQACRGSFKDFIDSKTVLMCKQRVKSLVEAYNDDKHSLYAKDMFDLYFLVSKARQILTGWGWQESIRLSQLTNQSVVSIFSGAKQNIESFKWFRENSRDYQIWLDKGGESVLIDMAESLLETNIDIKGGVERDSIISLYKKVFIPALIKNLQA